LLFRSGAVRIGTVVAITLVLVLAVLWRRRHAKSRVWFYPQLVKALERRAHRPLGQRTLREFVRQHASALQPHQTAFDFLVETYYLQRFSNANTELIPRARIRTALGDIR
jgi:hypothetical protein